MRNQTGLVTVCGAAIFLGSALLFNVQPMAGRMLLPRFGGSASVWIVCLVAFQVLLLFGYAYAALVARLPLRVQVVGHLVLLTGAALWPGFSRLTAAPGGESLPQVWRVLVAVTAGVGPAYLLLASGSSLLQAWLARALPGWNVYRLYAVSNAGSFVGLFAYPFLIEPSLALPDQQRLWRGLLGLYALLVATTCGWMVWRVRREPAFAGRLPELAGGASAPATESGMVGPSGQRTRDSQWPDHPVWWWILPLLGSFLLTAATASIAQDIPPLPMVWCLLLGSFLLSYVIGFSRVGETRIPLWATLATGTLLLYAVMRWQAWGQLTTLVVVVNGAVLFGGLLLNGWLYAIRPDACRLPGFYLALAGGGAAGGLAAGIGAPLAFKGVYEYSLAASVIAVLAAFSLWHGRRRAGGFELWATTGLAAGVLLVEPLICTAQVFGATWRNRNFYGVLKTTEGEMTAGDGRSAGKLRGLVHDTTQHGFEVLSGAWRGSPTAYYGPQGGGFPIRQQVLQHPRAALRVAVVGLGIGTLAGYGRAGDQYRFYEINPQVVDVARDTNQFTCLSRTAATVEFVLGDARLTLAREAAANDPPWDVLVVDAFSGDAVPVHLLTREAVALFLGRTAPDGITAFHISNWFIDLLPLLKAAAKAEGVHLWAWHNLPQGSPIESDSRWVLMTRKPRVFRAEGAMLHLPEAIIPDHPVMTDEKGSILPLVDWRRNRLGRYFQAAREFQANPPK